MGSNTDYPKRPALWTILRFARLTGAIVLLVAATNTASDTSHAQEPIRPEVPTQMAPPDAQSTTGPTPPPGVDVAGISFSPQAAVVISTVPPYLWHHGCGPTAAGMVIGYWDGHGFGSLVPGDASTQTTAVDEMIASEGPASNYTDYCIPIDHYPDLFPDKSENPPGDEHPDECVADSMKSSQSYHQNRYGWSWLSHMGPAMKDYVDALGQNDYLVTVNNLYMWWYPWLDWDLFRAEIDAGRPVVLLVDTNADGSTDHFVTAVGYDTVGGIRKYACLNTWDTEVHWFDFAPIEDGQPWGIYGAVTFRILGLNTRTFCPLVLQSYPGA